MAVFSGLFSAYFISHSFYIPLIYGLCAGLYVYITRQSSSSTAKLLKHPVTAAVVASLLYIVLFFITTPFLWDYPFARGAEYALSHLWPAELVFAAPLLLASLVVPLVKDIHLPALIHKETVPLQSTNSERSILTRLLSAIAPMLLALVVFLVAGDLVIANNASRQVIDSQLRTTADAVAAGLPQALQTGEDYLQQIAAKETLLTAAKPADLNKFLKGQISETSYFDQLTLLDAQGSLLAGFPEENAELVLTQEEYIAVQLAANGVDMQTLSLPPAGRGRSGRVAFITPVINQKDAVKAVLVGHTSLDTNPFIQPLITSLAALQRTGGEGLLLDEGGLIVYHTDPELIGQPYQGELHHEENASMEPAPQGGRQLVYYRPVNGLPWSVVTLVPAKVAQSTSMYILIPLLSLLLLGLAVGYVVLRYGLKQFTGSLGQLAEDAAYIGKGNLDRPVNVRGEDEIGRLGQSFDEMRLNLKNRLEEVNKLLSVTQGVASALELENAVKPILEGALATGASSARIVLIKEALSEFEDESKRQFGLGPSANIYRMIDEQVLALTEEKDQIVLPNPAGAGLQSISGQPLPASLIAFALLNEQDYYGAMWLAYDEPHEFYEDEVRFIATVAGQAALAAANARLYSTAFLGHQRLDAILNSTADPVLVTDHYDRLLLANPAAQSLFGIDMERQADESVERIVEQTDLLNLMQSRSEKPQTTEVSFEGKKVYRATVSPVLVDKQFMGRVCVLSDITQFKEVDALKTEFVSTVSHDLRSPLTLMQGYATMLQMVGDLNTQQTTYVNKSVTGVDRMSRLVNNLLDLGRIEAGVGLQVDTVSITDTIRQVIDALQMQATQKKIELKLEAPDEIIPQIEADQALLQQALHNLVDNAIKYTDAGGKVLVKLTPRLDDLLVEVKDTGTGIAPVDMPRVFERFFRGVGQKSVDPGGSGLGLAIVKSIAEKHGGGVWLDSQLGKGSTFFMNIPLRQPR